MGPTGAGPPSQQETALPQGAPETPPEAVQEKRVGDLMVAVFPARETARVGENAIRIRVRDSSGNPIANATVTFSYTMDMAGMPIEQSETQSLGDGVYEGTVKFTMGGPWGLIVQIDRPGQAPLREKFTIRVAG
jgi:uncharacterized GH25 family protein